MCINTIILLVKAHIFLDAYFFAVRAIRRCMHLTTSRYGIVSTTLSRQSMTLRTVTAFQRAMSTSYLSRVTRCTSMQVNVWRVRLSFIMLPTCCSVEIF